MTKDSALKLALEALEYSGNIWHMNCPKDKVITAIKTALAQPKQEPVATMPSNTRYTVEVEGYGRTYWDNIHDAITCAQRAVYSGPENTTRALDDLKAGRFAEWSYGFSAVRIYPPQNTTPPQEQQSCDKRKPLTDEEIWDEVKAADLDWQTGWSLDEDASNRYITFARAIEAAHGIKE